MTNRPDLESLLKIVDERRTTPRQGKSISEILDRFGRPEISDERMAEIREHAEQRRKQGFRSLTDLTEAEVDALEAGRAGMSPEPGKPVD